VVGPSRLIAPDCPRYPLAPSSARSLVGVPMHPAEQYPEWPALACRSAHWLSAFACKNRFEPLLWADPNQRVNVAAGRCTRATLVRALHLIDRATRVTAKTPPRQSGCASKNKEWRRSLKRRESHPRPAADSTEILPSNTASRSLLACSCSASSALLARFLLHSA